MGGGGMMANNGGVPGMMGRMYPGNNAYPGKGGSAKTMP